MDWNIRHDCFCAARTSSARFVRTPKSCRPVKSMRRTANYKLFGVVEEDKKRADNVWQRLILRFTGWREIMQRKARRPTNKMRIFKRTRKWFRLVTEKGRKQLCVFPHCRCTRESLSFMLIWYWINEPASACIKSKLHQDTYDERHHKMVWYNMVFGHEEKSIQTASQSPFASMYSERYFI